MRYLCTMHHSHYEYETHASMDSFANLLHGTNFKGLHAFSSAHRISLGKNIETNTNCGKLEGAFRYVMIYSGNAADSKFMNNMCQILAVILRQNFGMH